MALNRYYYNPKTCQFEPAPVQVGSVLTYMLGLLVFSASLFAGLLALENKVRVTDPEHSLRQENEALRKHSVVLTAELASAQQSLNDIKQMDDNLQRQLFQESESHPLELSQESTETYLDADRSTFNKLYKKVSITTSHLLNFASAGNTDFASSLIVNQQDIPRFRAYPTYLPVAHPAINRVASGFGMRINPFHKALYPHTGIDFAAARGTEVVAAGSGRVIEVRYSDLQAGYGNVVEIDHGGGLVTRYSHLDRFLVKLGQKISVGQPLGTVGMTGGAVAPHLHYEMLIHGRQVDPVPYLIEGFTADTYALIVQHARVKNQSLD